MKKIKRWLKNYNNSLSYVGLIVAVTFFSISLSPSLLPRPYILQGVLSGFSLLVGYSLGVACTYLWHYLELPAFQKQIKTTLQYIISALSILIFIYTIYASNNWQNELRILMGQTPNEEFLYIQMIAIALLLAFSLLFIARLFKKSFNNLRFTLHKLIPRRIANVLGLSLIAFIVFTFTNNFIVSKVVTTFDEIYSIADENTDSGIKKPTNILSTGSNSSLIQWKNLGRTGQNFIANGPTQAELTAFFAQKALAPLRVYVGLRSRESAEQRAQLALQELIRIKGFSRKKLIIATPTGTGWLDPSAMNTFEYLHQGDTAIVSMQYSYLPSWLTLLVDPSGAKRSALVLYNTIHRYWSTLPKKSRPDLYVFGLSLGALGAETSINLTTIINNPIQGGLFAGAPFPSTVSPQLIKQRNPDSPQWLPTIQDGSLVRFTAQENQLHNENWHWGPMRFVYIQYASDPMVFFSLDLYRKEPDWMKGERGHDVSPDFNWYPIITFLQVLFDLPMADKVPRGSSHKYSASSYIDGWVEVTQPKGLSKQKLKSIKDHFSDQ